MNMHDVSIPGVDVHMINVHLKLITIQQGLECATDLAPSPCHWDLGSGPDARGASDSAVCPASAGGPGSSLQWCSAAAG